MAAGRKGRTKHRIRYRLHLDERRELVINNLTDIFFAPFVVAAPLTTPEGVAAYDLLTETDKRRLYEAVGNS